MGSVEFKRYDRLSAAHEQLIWSIGAFWAGAWVASITLALAAEECVPPEESSVSAFGLLRSEWQERGFDPPNASTDHPNHARNWLKHHDRDPKHLFVNSIDARVAIVRGLFQLEAAAPQLVQHPSIVEFMDWLKAAAKWETPQLRSVTMPPMS